MPGPLAAAAVRILSRFARGTITHRGTASAGGHDVEFEVDERRFTRDLLRLDKVEMHRARVRALGRIVTLGRRRMRLRAPVGATARLSQGLSEGILPARLEGRIVGKARHTRPVLHGSRPHWPPRRPLQRWVRRKLGITNRRELRRVTFLVARKIARKGTRRQDFVSAPFRHMVKRAPVILQQELRKVKAVK